jgi:hypothetical protein
MKQMCLSGAAAIALAMLVACAGKDSPSPTSPSTPSPAPAPTPTAPTYTLTGVVREALPNPRLLSNTRVEITDGPDRGVFAMTDGNGSFRLSSVTAGVLTVQATKDGYLLWKVANFTVAGDSVLDVTLFPTPPSNAAGTVATARCADGSWSWAQTRGDACIAGGGVAYGVCPGPLCDGR